MKLEGEHIFNGPREDVWEMLGDPEVLCSAFPGTQTLNKNSNQEYEGAIQVRIGPVSGIYSGKLTVSDEVPPESCTLMVDGRGSSGFARGSGSVQFTDQGDCTTLMKYGGDMQIGGNMASVGQRMLDNASKSVLSQALEALDKALEARLAAKTSEIETAGDQPPSETGSGEIVASDAPRGILQIAEVRMILYVLPIAIILALVAYFLTR